jgi:uncharacterized C2H2 Zn-finger protein
MEEKKIYLCKICDKIYKNYKSLWKHTYVYHKHQNTDNDTNENVKKKFTCDKCNKNFKNLDEIKNHTTNDCKPSLKSNNIYKFKVDTFGKNKYKNFNGGDIYIIQTDFNLKGFYKIGITTNLTQRLSDYRCCAVLEPKLHYYYPCKYIKEADKILKEKLKQFNVKREIYNASNIDDLRNTIKEVQKESGCSVIEVKPENKEDIIPCDYCNLFFTYKQDFFGHIEKNHKIEFDLDKQYNQKIDEKYKCPECDKNFTRPDSLTRHINKNRCKKINKLNKLNKKDTQIKYLQEEFLKIKNELSELKHIVSKITIDRQIEITD